MLLRQQRENMTAYSFLLACYPALYNKPLVCIPEVGYCLIMFLLSAHQISSDALIVYLGLLFSHDSST